MLYEVITGVEVEEIFEETDKSGKKQKIVQFSINPDRPSYNFV